MTKTCSGKSYILQPTDTFYSLPNSEHIATDQLLSSNGLSYNVTDFPKSGSLCIENTCATHIVKANETCVSIAESASVTYSQLMSWNININGVCSNLNDMINQTICISNPLGNYTVTENKEGSPTLAVTPAPVPKNQAPNTTTDCGRYYAVKTGDTCSTVSLKFGIKSTDLLDYLSPPAWSFPNYNSKKLLS